MPIVDIPRTHLNLAAVLLNGQSFRWLEKEGSFYGTARERLWKIRRIDEKNVEYRVLASVSGKGGLADEEEKSFKEYFNLDVDMDKLYASWSAADPYIKGLLSNNDDLKGIRILAQDPFETLFAFICSANNNIKRISKMVNRLCVLYGSRLLLHDEVSSEEQEEIEKNDQLMYAFPTLEQLQKNLDGMEERLRKEGFGYRAAYIAGSVRHLATTADDLETLRFPNEAKERLLLFSGVGPKVADCVSLMGLGHHHVVPVDTHVFKCTVKRYRKDLDGKALNNGVHTELGKFYKELFGDYAGWAQAIIFNAQLLMKEEKTTKESGKKKKEKKM